MTETPAPTEHEVNTRMHVYRIMDTHLDRAFEELDNLHKRGIHDTEVIKALRDGGYVSEADAYIEWGNLQDPDSDVSNATTDPRGVTDPGTNESDLQMQAAYEKLSDPAFIMSGHPFEHFHDGDGGHGTPFTEAYVCGSPDCSEEYDVWVQQDGTMDGLEEFLSEERRDAAWTKHAAHLAEQIKDAKL